MALKIQDLVNDVNLEVVAGSNGLEREVKVEMLSRPGVELAGFIDFYDPERIILIGTKENSFLQLLPRDIQIERIENLLQKEPPAVVFSANVEIDDVFCKLGDKYKVPILKSELRTTPLNGSLYAYLRSKLAPRTSLHGVLLDIHGLGTIIMGKSGIGKSETALELIKRGHILISDDRVDVFEASPGVLIGVAPKLLERYIEIRGIGIVNVVNMFGAGAYRENKKVRLIVHLEPWVEGKQYDRLGIENEVTRIFNTDLIKVTIPILPGRNVATLVESAAMNIKLKMMGHNAAQELAEAVAKAASGKD